MVKAKKYIVKRHFHGVPKRDDFDVVEYELPPLEDGEILVQAEWISVDPYLRAYNAVKEVPYDQFGFQVGIVQQSKNPEYPVGIRVVTHKGWATYFIINPDEEDDAELAPMYKLPDLPKGLSPSLGISAIAMVGATAYFGLLEVCEAKAGETVVVTGAAGAVGSLVGQIAKIKGCKVIGFAGSDLKAKWLEEELKFDKVFNYKTVNVAEALKEAAPNGVDCYFDNVGGEISSTIISHMNEKGRIAICGCISSYNEINRPKVSMIQPDILFKSLNMQGFLIWHYRSRWPEAFAELIKWIQSGELKVREHVTEGFDNLFDALIAMLNGENFGKALVKV